MSQRNEAYDFSLFEQKPKEERGKRDNIIELSKTQLKQSRKAKVRPVRAIATFLTMAVIVGIVGTMVYGQVQLTELTEELNSATKQAEEDKSVYTQLKMKSDSRLSLQAVEAYAEDKLGMHKISQNQVKCISLSQGDKGEVLQKSSDGWFASFWNTVQNLLS